VAATAADDHHRPDDWFYCVHLGNLGRPKGGRQWTIRGKMKMFQEISTRGKGQWEGKESMAPWGEGTDCTPGLGQKKKKRRGVVLVYHLFFLFFFDFFFSAII